MSGIDRTQIVRIDCTNCRGTGHTAVGGVESLCEPCEGRGMLEREVPFKFETNGRRTKEEIADVFQLPVEQVNDIGHSTGE